MKKSGVWLVLFLCFSFKVFAEQDRYGSMRPAAWLSSRTASVDPFVVVSSNPANLISGTTFYSNAVVIHGVNITSPTVNIQPSYLVIFNSTTSPFSPNTAYTTMTYINTNVWVSSNGSTSIQNYFPYDIVLSTGFVYNKVGGADITILWDYLLPSFGR